MQQADTSDSKAEAGDAVGNFDHRTDQAEGATTKEGENIGRVDMVLVDPFPAMEEGAVELMDAAALLLVLADALDLLGESSGLGPFTKGRIDNAYMVVLQAEAKVRAGLDCINQGMEALPRSAAPKPGARRGA